MAQGKLEKRCSSRLCRCVLSLAGGTTVRYADEGFFDMAGFPREYLETSCGGSLKTASPQLYGQICAMREQPDNPGRGEAEFRYQRADGTELWLYLNGGLAELEGERRLECLFLDVTELVVARTRLENITNTIPGGVVQLSFGEDWRILYANDGFYRLNGYTRQEYRALAGDLFIRLMHPDDEAVFETAVREMIGTRQTGVADYRVRQKDGSWRWRVAYGKMIGSTEEGVPVIQCVILDNEEKRQLEQKLELENERYQAVAQMSDGVLWEYNAAEDEAIVPYSVRSVLVDQMRTPGFSDSAYAQGTVHPEDLPRLEQFRRELREGKPHILFEFRARQPRDGEYRWHRAEGVTLCGADGRPARTVGRTADIDREKRERLRLRDAAERDPMTGLYNRSVVQRLIDERFEQDPPVRAGSLFVVDIDNFKAVNDRLGHLFGDVLLTNIAKAMRETVRPGDILGRIGGDEFVVFLPGASRAEGERIAGELVARVSRIYAGEFTDLQITASVGVADCPRCGDHYVELFRKADRALYRAKRHGKDRAEAYEPDGRGADGEESLLNLYEMDRPEVRWHDGEMESMLDLFPRILSSSKDIDSAIYLMLDRIGEYCRAADVGILERTPKGDRLQATYLWKRGTGRVPISSEEAFSFSQWPGYLQRFEEGVYTEPDGAMLPGCVRPDRRCALLQCGIYDEGAFSGCVVVCDRGGRHDWTRQEIALTLGFARAVTPYILKRRTAAEAQYRLDRALNFDELTGLLSLGSFKERAAAYLAASPRSRCAIIYSDIVNFKYINDAYGFTTGDEVLRDFARAITERGGAVCSARLGNDSFISLTRYESLDQLEKHISRIDQEFNAGVREKLPGSNVMVASGVCPLSLTQGDLVEAIDNANIARKSIKGFHKGGCAIFEEGMKRRLSAEAQMANRMEYALENREFVVYLQPKVALRDGRMVGAEALVRWRRQDGSIIPPDEFIPFFERNGFVTRIDLYVLDRVLERMSVWKAAGKRLVPLSVNISRIHGDSPNQAEKILELTRRWGIEPAMIEFELTETALFQNAGRVRSLLEKLMEMGFGVSIDDFGAGYSSLNVLPSIPANILKLDKGFLQGRGFNERNRTLVRHMISMAVDLNFRVICEGVETAQDVEFLRAVGCDMAQGYYFARPMPIDEFEERWME